MKPRPSGEERSPSKWPVRHRLTGEAAGLGRGRAWSPSSRAAKLGGWPQGICAAQPEVCLEPGWLQRVPGSRGIMPARGAHGGTGNSWAGGLVLLSHGGWRGWGRGRRNWPQGGDSGSGRGPEAPLETRAPGAPHGL